MIQTYSPNFIVPSKRGWCLLYIDDAGGLPATIPPRTAKAKYAYNNELSAGRIRLEDSPIGIWVVGFLDFTTGPYVVDGHVFFMNNLGGGLYEIRDSEVATGTRTPYGSLEELVSWFGAYNPKFIGWSTNCDSREYAKEGDDMIENNDSEYDRWKLAIRRLRGGPAADRFTREYFNNNIVGQQSKTVLDSLMRAPEADYRELAGDVGNLAIQGDWWDKLTEKSSVAGLSKVDVDNAVKQAQEALDAVNKLKGE